MTDYRTLLRHAGLPDEEVERIAAQAEADDAAKVKEDADLDAMDAEMERDRGTEKLIALHMRHTGLEPRDNHSVIVDGQEITIVLADEPRGYGLSQLMDFANRLAKDGVGSDLRIAGNSDNNVTIFLTRHS